MNRRISKKNRRRIYLLLLEKAMNELDENDGIYSARALHIPSVEVRTLTNLNGYRIEIRSSREEKHNLAHFHVMKNKSGKASIRIDNLEVVESSLDNKTLKRVLDWAEENRNLLVSVWNEFHGYRILVE